MELRDKYRLQLHSTDSLYLSAFVYSLTSAKFERVNRA